MEIAAAALSTIVLRLCFKLSLILIRPVRKVYSDRRRSHGLSLHFVGRAYDAFFQLKIPIDALSSR